MNASFHHGKTIFFITLLVALSVFTADVIDLREELRILACPYTCLDNNITTAVASNVPVEPEPLPILFSVSEKASVEISILHPLSYSFRAPPFRP